MCPEYEPRRVSISIQSFWGAGGEHYHVTISESDNPLWNHERECWQECWDDKDQDRKGAITWEKFDRLSEALDFVLALVKEKYQLPDWRATGPGGESFEDHIKRYRQLMTATGPFFYDSDGD